MADAVVPIMVILIGGLVVAYALFIRWRIRVHRERREAAAAPPRPAPTLSSMLAEQRSDGAGAEDQSPASQPTPPPAPADRTDPSDTPARSMADAVSGISLPDTLSPFIDAAHRPCVERAAFLSTTSDPVALRDGVGERFAAIGYDVSWDGLAGRARRGPTVIQLEVYPHASAAVLGDQQLFPTAPANVAAVDIWLP